MPAGMSPSSGLAAPCCRGGLAGRGGIDLIGDGAGRMLVPARDPGSRQRASPSRTFTTVNMPPISIGPNWPEAGHHRQRVVGQRHLHFAHHRPCRRCPSPWRPAPRCSTALASALLRDADEVLHVVAHGVHGVVRLVAVKRPVARSVGDEVERAHRRRPARRSSPPAIARSPAPSRRRCRSPRSGGRADGSDGWSW